ncbi:hypothetical protein OQA88_8633 [Cercophora sp. LCS_1]
MEPQPATLSHPTTQIRTPPATFLPPSHGAGPGTRLGRDAPITNGGAGGGDLVPSVVSILVALVGFALESARSRAQAKKDSKLQNAKKATSAATSPASSTRPRASTTAGRNVGWESASDVGSSTSYFSDSSSTTRDAITIDFPSRHGELRPLQATRQAYYYAPANNNRPGLRHPAFTDRTYRENVNNHISRLANDLRAYLDRRRVTNADFSVEFRLAGRVKPPNLTQIELRPIIYVSCTAERVKKLIEKALRDSDLEWATTFETWVRVGGLVLNSARTAIQVTGLDLASGGGFRFRDLVRVYLHLQVPDDGVSACGLLLCATITYKGAVVDQRLSRLGGLLKVDGTATWATSTAHGIVDALYRCSRMEPEPSIRNRPGEPGAEHPTDSRDGEEEDEINESHSDDRFSSHHQTLLGHVNPRKISRWRQITDIRALEFIQPAITAAPGASRKRAHDFALFGVWDRLQNSYVEDGSRHLIHGYLKDKDLPTADEDVKILLGGGVNPSGRIQPLASSIYLSGAEFKTKKISLPSPLGMRSF